MVVATPSMAAQMGANGLGPRAAIFAANANTNANANASASANPQTKPGETFLIKLWYASPNMKVESAPSELTQFSVEVTRTVADFQWLYKRLVAAGALNGFGLGFGIGIDICISICICIGISICILFAFAVAVAVAVAFDFTFTFQVCGFGVLADTGHSKKRIPPLDLAHKGKAGSAVKAYAAQVRRNFTVDVNANANANA